jgi:hypothetical protein
MPGRNENSLNHLIKLHEAALSDAGTGTGTLQIATRRDLGHCHEGVANPSHLAQPSSPAEVFMWRWLEQARDLPSRNPMGSLQIETHVTSNFVGDTTSAKTN